MIFKLKRYVTGKKAGSFAGNSFLEFVYNQTYKNFKYQFL
jgi:hypothetical protein